MNERTRRLCWNDILSEGEEGLTDGQKAALNDYFRVFALAPRDDDGKELCPNCDSRMVGGIEGALLGGMPGNATLTWGIAHGEATCTECGWPYRVYHRNIGVIAGGDPLIKSMNLALPYHPSCVDMKQEPPAA